MSRLGRIAFAAGIAGVIGLESVAVARWQGWLPSRGGPVARVDAAPSPLDALPPALSPVPIAVADPVLPSVVQELPEATVPAAASKPVPVTAPQPADARYYAQLHARLRWVQTRLGDVELRTPDLASRMLLVRSAAQRAGLHEVGLSHRDVYGLINAETSWIPRTGASRDGTPNIGIAQFEPATARGLGVRDPEDVVEAVHAAASHMKDAALWSAQRIARLPLGESERAEKLREGVSIYYNLSVRGRNVWNGRNTQHLPAPTRQHIRNARIGAREAAQLDVELQAHRPGRAERPSVEVAAAP